MFPVEGHWNTVAEEYEMKYEKTRIWTMDREFHVQMANFSHTNISDVCFYFPQSKEKIQKQN